jgi:hypothetical protein
MTSKSIPIIYIVLPASLFDNTIFKALIIIIDIFSPPGELISLQNLRFSPLTVVHYTFVGHCLAFATT